VHLSVAAAESAAHDLGQAPLAAAAAGVSPSSHAEGGPPGADAAGVHARLAGVCDCVWVGVSVCGSVSLIIVTHASKCTAAIRYCFRAVITEMCMPELPIN